MKKIYSLITVCSFAAFGFAQVEIVEQGQSTDVSGTTLYVNVTEDGLVAKNLVVKNVSGSANSLSVVRYRLVTPAGWTDGLCWGPTPDPNFEGQCYGASQMPTNPWMTPNSPTLGVNGEGSMIVDIHTQGAGCGHYRYYVMNGQTPVDSVDIEVCSTLGVDEPEVVKGMTAYPNPANGVLTVSATGLEDYQIRMTDVLGKVVYDETASAPKKSIDVSDFKNGVYLVTVLEKGSVIQTRRVVVKH